MNFRRFVEILNLSFFILILFLGGVGSRFSEIFSWPLLPSGINVIRLLALTIGALTLAMVSRRLISIVLLCAAFLVFHSLFHLFQPSLRPDIPVQDWLFPGGVSARYSFDQVYRYLRNISFFLFPALALRQSRHIPEKYKLYLPLCVLGLAFFVNSVVALVQGLHSLQFLSKGSGTALHAGRAAALLEDSGASTVYFSMGVSALFSALIFFRGNIVTRLILLLLFLCGFMGGAYTSGRIFYGATIGSFVVLAGLSLWKTVRTRQIKHVFAIGLGLSLLTVFVSYAVSRHMPQRAQIGSLLMSLWNGQFFDLNHFLSNLDPVRANHWRTMWKAFIEHPILGTGFGTFYSNYHHYLPWALQYGGYTFADPPASMYLLLISELGVSGLLICALYFQQIGRLLKNIMRSSSPDLFSCCAFAILLSLSFSFLIGIHVIFASITSVFVAAIVLWPQPSSRDNLIQKSLLIAVGILMATGCLKAFVQAPRPPAFNWAIRKMPQVPVTIKLPIAAPYPGKWFKAGTELFLAKEKNYFFMEMPPQYYPLHLAVTLYDKHARARAVAHYSIPSYELPKPGRMLSFEVPRSLKSECFQDINPDSFCSFRIDTNPVWKYEGFAAGFYLHERAYKDTQIPEKLQ